MSRNSWIMFGMVAIVVISILLVALLILVPQSEPLTEGIVDDYEKIAESEYSYTQSKDISEEAMKETYSVTSEDIQEGKAAKLYKQGNTDPFAAIGGTTAGSGNSSNNGNSGSTGNNSSSKNGTTTVTPYSADNK